MIYKGTDRGGVAVTVVECEKPECPESSYLYDLGEYSAAEAMRGLGWEVVPVRGQKFGILGYESRCPEHAEVATPPHQHSWVTHYALGYQTCRHCGTRRPE